MKLGGMLRYFSYILLGIGVIGAILPMIWMVSASLMDESNIFDYPPHLIPKAATIKNYIEVFRQIPFLRYFLNSCIVSAAVVISCLFFASLASYAFAKIPFPGSKPLFMGVLATQMIPGTVTLIPAFLIIRSMHLLDTYWALILPFMTGGYSIFFLKQFMETVPNELIDAARIDGCNEFMIYSQVVLPVIRPGLATLGSFIFMGSWNNFLWPLIVISESAMRTLPLALALLDSMYYVDWGIRIAGSVLTTLPIFLIYLFAQRQFIEGITMGALKG